MKKIDSKGFSIIEVLLVVSVLVVLGAVGGYVYKAHHKRATMTPAAKTSASVTSDQLITVAQKVFWQDAGPASDPPTITFCGVGGTTCPFTSQLTSKLTAFKGEPGFGSPLVGGEQDGPFGILSFNAVPSSNGGTVRVNLTPSTSEANEGNGRITWVLTVKKSNGQLKVSNVTITMAAAGKQPGCGPVEIYNDLSC